MKYAGGMTAQEVTQLLSVLAEGKRQIVLKLLQKVTVLEEALGCLEPDGTLENVASRKYILSKIEENMEKIVELQKKI